MPLARPLPLALPLPLTRPPPAPAAGTFLYVAFMEVIPKELRDQEAIPLKLAALLVGFAAMSVLAIWA